MKNEQKKKFILKLCVFVLCFYFVGGTDWVLSFYQSAAEKNFKNTLVKEFESGKDSISLAQLHDGVWDRLCVQKNDLSSRPDMSEEAVIEWLGIDELELSKAPSFLFEDDKFDIFPRPYVQLVLVFLNGRKIVSSFESRSPYVNISRNFSDGKRYKRFHLFANIDECYSADKAQVILYPNYDYIVIRE